MLAGLVLWFTGAGHWRWKNRSGQRGQVHRGGHLPTSVSLLDSMCGQGGAPLQCHGGTAQVMCGQDGTRRAPGRPQPARLQGDELGLDGWARVSVGE